MATGISVGQANIALDTALAGTTWIQLHTGSPGAAGTSNVASNSTRKSTTMASASAGDKATNASISWTSVPTTETYTFFTVWTASSAGTFLYSGSITGGAVTAGNDFSFASAALVCSITEAS